jgi:protein O-mannosyl-transferase
MARSQARVATQPSRISLWPALLVLVITFVAFFPSLSNGFVNWDDNINIYENKTIETLDWAHVKAIFTNTVIGGYNPLTILTFAVERHFVGLNPKLYHVDNLVLHLACVFLAFVFLRMLKLGTWAAVFGSLLFAIHPMRVESVAWVTERKDVLYAAFYLGALVAYVRYLQSNCAKKYLFIAMGLFALSLFAKIQAVALPLSFLALDYYFKRPIRLKVLLEKVPFFLMSLAVGGIGVYLLSKSETLKELGGFGLVDRLFIGAYSLGVYLIKAIVPFSLSAIYPYPARLTPEFYLAPVGIVALLWFIWTQHRRGNHAVVFGFAFFAVNIVFVLQILGAGQGFLADRFPYVAYLGLFFIGAKLLEKALADKSWSSFAQGAAAIYVGVFAVVTWNQCSVWRDGETLWTAVMKKYPSDPLAYGQRGFWYRSKGRREEALTDYNRAVEILDKAPEKFTKDKVTVHNSRGKTLFDMGRTPEAIADYTKAIQYDPTYAEAYINRGAAYGKSGQNELALADFNKGIELDPKAANAYFNRSLLYSQMNKFELAIRDHDAYLQFNPGNKDILFERAVAKRQLGRNAEAVSEFNDLLRLDPNQPDVYLERSRAYRDLGKREEALRDAKMAKSSGMKVDDIYLQQLQQ